MPEPPPPTIREIAAACGVHHSTVSRALRGHPSISSSQSNSIRRKADEMGWRPNGAASLVMSHLRRTGKIPFQGTLGFLHTDPSPDPQDFEWDLLRTAWHCAKKRAAELGFGLDSIWLHEPALSVPRIAAILHARGINGVIVPGIVKPWDKMPVFPWEDYAFVCLGFSQPIPEAPRVSCSLVHGIRLLAAHINAAGYSPIGFAANKETNERLDRQIEAGFLLCSSNRPKRKGNPILLLDPSDRDPCRTISDWFETFKPAVVVGENWMLETLEGLCCRNGIPLRFLSLDAPDNSANIAGMDQRHGLAAALAVDAVVGQLMRHERGYSTVSTVINYDPVWKPGLSFPEQAGAPGSKRTGSRAVR